MDTKDILVFTTASQAGSLSEAARRLGLAPMAATRSLASLERELGVRLMHRTTRSLSLTPEGHSFLPFAVALVENDEQARALFEQPSRGAQGLLRVSVSNAFGRKVVAPLVPNLLEQNPELRISLEMSDSQPDLVASGVDLAIRIARLRDSSLIARKLADNTRYLVAAPAYLEKHGTPRSMDELSAFDCLPLSGISHWTFRHPKAETTTAMPEEKDVRVSGRFSSDSIDGCHAACLSGSGIALLSHWTVSEDLEKGQLTRLVLDDAEPSSTAIWAVYPTPRYVLPKVRLFIEAVRKSLAQMAVPDQ